MTGRSAEADGLSQAEPEVSALRASIPIALPADYDALSREERREVRLEYIRLQSGKCYHCGGDLSAEPPASIKKLRIDWRQFPPNFLRWPHHLHHDHHTGMTIGTVHALCNAVLWQYHGE